MTNISKHKQKDRFVDSVGRVVFTSDGLADLLIEGREIDGLFSEVSVDALKYNQFSDKEKLILYDDEMASETIEEYDRKAVSSWKTPEKYYEIDLNAWLLARCSDEIQKDRVRKELNMYEERNLFPLLKHLIYLIEHFRKNDIVWGVGRGSCCASYILYLIGVHRVDSIKYNIEIEEFLR